MGLCLFHHVSGDVSHCETSDHVIKLRASDVTYSQGVRGRILLDDDSIKQRLMSAVHLGVITVEIECARWTHALITNMIKRMKSSDAFSSRAMWQNLDASSPIGQT